eukprot:350634-Chlamydomonas_euryale.AAC.1
MARSSKRRMACPCACVAMHGGACACVAVHGMACARMTVHGMLCARVVVHGVACACMAVHGVACACMAVHGMVCAHAHARKFSMLTCVSSLTPRVSETTTLMLCVTIHVPSTITNCGSDGSAPLSTLHVHTCDHGTVADSAVVVADLQPSFQPGVTPHDPVTALPHTM